MTSLLTYEFLLHDVLSRAEANIVVHGPPQPGQRMAYEQVLMGILLDLPTNIVLRVTLEALPIDMPE